MGEAWFRNHARTTRKSARIRGVDAGHAAAIAAAADVLGNADYPLVYGLSRSATPGQRAAVELAEKLGGAIDTTASMCHGPSIMALQEVGEVASTLGEIRNRADVVVFWGCDPASSHPRHAERYSAMPEGRFVPNGRDDRTVVFVGDSRLIDSWRLTPGGARADVHIRIDPGSDYESLSMLRAMQAGQSVKNVPDSLRQLLNLMTTCRYGVVFFGLGIAQSSMWEGGEHSPTGDVSVAALLQLVADLNSVTRFTARRMRLQGDVSGADNVMLWQTGYPFGVDFSRGYPRYGPGEFTANDLLERRDVDACLLLGTETVRYFSDAARDFLATIPTVVVEYPNVRIPFAPTVEFTSAVYGIHALGTVFRMDNVPLPLNAMLPTELSTDEEILTAIRARLVD